MSEKIIYLTEGRRSEWDEFCEKSDSAWFRHTGLFLDCIVNCKFDKKSIDLSFGVYQNNELISVVPLIAQSVHEEPGILEFAFADTNIPFPAFKNILSQERREDVLKSIFAEIDKIALEKNVSYSRFFVDPLSEDVLGGRQRINPLTRFGYHESSLSTSILSLAPPEDEIFRAIRKGHKCDIKAAEKAGFSVDILNKDNISKKIFDIYKDLHYRDAGRKTRPDESWDAMYRFIENGDTVLALLKKDGTCIAGAIVIVYKKKAYYGSGATDPDLCHEKGIGHLLQWSIIQYLKQTGNNFYEMGWDYYPVISQNIITEKEINISRFKSGFGGERYPLFRGEKFYSRDYFLKAYSERMDKYLACWDDK